MQLCLELSSKTGNPEKLERDGSYRHNFLNLAGFAAV